jgi:uncharacterized protein YccT (UPF0319 family)
MGVSRIDDTSEKIVRFIAMIRCGDDRRIAHSQLVLVSEETGVERLAREAPPE